MYSIQLKQAKKGLENSPMFQLSLSSKELFHSNFLFWIGKANKFMFRELIQQLYENGTKNNIAFIPWEDNFEIKRECNNFDISVIKDNKIIFILENKVKSIPKLSQLDDYTIKVPDASCMLLSLVKNFPEKETINDKWAIIDYNMLADKIEELYPRYNLDQYHSAIIKDYCGYIRNLDSIVAEWVVKGNEKWSQLSNNEIKTLSDLRIDDLYKKLRYACILNLIMKRIDSDMLGFKWGMNAKDIFDGKKIKNNRAEKREAADTPFAYIYVDFGMTRSNGLFELKVKVADNLLLLIQVEGKQYRRAIERKAKYFENVEFLRNPDNPIHDFFAFKEGTFPKIGYPDVSHGEKISPFRTFEDQEQNGFCKYKDWFIYQYVPISDDTEVEKVVTAVIQDIRLFIDLKGIIGNGVAD